MKLLFKVFLSMLMLAVTSSCWESEEISDPAESGYGGHLVWAKRAGGSSGDFGRFISALADGSSLVTGSFAGIATFGPDEINETYLNSNGTLDYDIFVAKYNADGTLAWTKRAGGNFNDLSSCISALSDGSALVTGSFLGTATFGPDEAGETSLVSDGNEDIFVAKYNVDGTLAWAKQAGGADVDEGYGISTLSDGSSLVTGHFAGIATFGQGEINQTILNNDGTHDIFVAKYNPDGSLAWAKQAGGADLDISNEISALPEGSALVTGEFKDTMTLGLGETNEITLNSHGNRDIFVAKYNADGTLAWAKRAGGSSDDLISGISALSGGSALVTGFFVDTAFFGPGETNETMLNTDSTFDIFVAKYNSDGTLAWAKRAGGNGWDEGNGISATSDGSALVTGHFSDTATFGQGETNETILNLDDEWDIFVAKYNADGTLAWAKSVGGSSGDSGMSISTLSDGSSLVTGIFEGTATFGLGETNETVLDSEGERDIFIAKFGP